MKHIKPFINVILVQSAWTGTPTPARFAGVDWDTCAASIGPLALVSLSVLLDPL